jgi:hypothetical protein
MFESAIQFRFQQMQELTAPGDKEEGKTRLLLVSFTHLHYPHKGCLSEM